MARSLLLITVVTLLCGCVIAGVRQQDLDSWVGMPVEALDTHSFFITLPMYRRTTESGIEVRNYPNGRNVEECFTSGGAFSYGKYANANALTTCSSGRVVCNNIFYIKNGVVLEYAPTGSCYTDETIQPQERHLRLRKQ